MTVPAYAARDFGATLAGAIAALPVHARLDILTPSETSETVRNWCVGRDAHIHFAPDTLDFTHWAQDAATGAVEDGRTVLMISNRFERQDDAEAARLLAEAAGLPIRRTDLPLDGGNAFAASGRLFAGADIFDLWRGASPDANRTPIPVGGPPGLGEVEAPSSFIGGWTEVRRTGSTEGRRQPLYHLDLFAAPAGEAPDGRPRIVLGCPRRGADLLGLPLLPHADADRFDAAADALSSEGVEVARSPQPLFWSDDVAARRRTWLPLPVNNVLVEIAETRRVYLPAFASETWPELARIDAAVRAIWEGLGFDCVVVPNCLPLAERRGALRCLINVIERG